MFEKKANKKRKAPQQELRHKKAPQSRDEQELKQAKSIRRKERWSKVFIFFIILNLVIGIAGGAIVWKMVSTAPKLDPKDFISEESSLIYDQDGNVITEVGVYLRENITYDQCPESLVDAFLSIEDSRYFSHFGFDIPRFTAAAITNLKNRNFAQGGSTFTMQLVKNTYFTVDAGDESKERTKSIDYKVQQIYLAIKLDKMLNKKEIFQLYMNKLNFGGRIRGVQRASLYYFGKDCTELTLPESAMLAGIINLPNRYNPKAYLDYGTKRRNEVLYLMKYHGYITEMEYNLAKAVKVEDLLIGDKRKAQSGQKYQSYIDVVLEEAQKMTGSDPSIRGMKIYTHLMPGIQSTIEDIQNGTTQVKYPDDLMQVAMVCVDNKTGGIVGIGGGRNYDGARLLNRATMNFKQPGSAVKPVLSYALAFENLGYTLDEILMDKPITYPRESMVLVNYNGQYQGDVTIRDAVGNSLNIPAILTLEHVEDKIGKDKIVDYMQNVGFSRVTKDNFHLSFAIGGTWFETTCKELAGANAMLANLGVYNEPHTISKIVMDDNNVIEPENQSKRMISPGSAWMTLQLMRGNVEGPYYNWMQILKRDYPVYAKTGTTDWGHDGVPYGIPVGQMKDKWMLSATSEFTNVVWVGYDMAVAGKETYYTRYKSNLNIPGNINKLLLDTEEQHAETRPHEIARPADVEDITYVYGTYPHVEPDEGMPEHALITSQVSKTGLENAPLVTVEQWKGILKGKSNVKNGITAKYDQYGRIKISWANPMGICSGGGRIISLHDDYNDIDAFGRCLVDLSWLAGETGVYKAEIFVDDHLIDEVSSTSGFYQGILPEEETKGKIKVCGGRKISEDGDFTNSCVVAVFEESEEPLKPEELEEHKSETDKKEDHETEDKPDHESHPNPDVTIPNVHPDHNEHSSEHPSEPSEEQD